MTGRSKSLSPSGHRQQPVTPRRRFGIALKNESVEGLSSEKKGVLKGVLKDVLNGVLRDA